MTKLQSPNFHVSRTRIIIYNVPKSMTEKVLKKLCIEAVTSRATKQQPVIRQVGYISRLSFVDMCCLLCDFCLVEDWHILIWCTCSGEALTKYERWQSC